MLVDIDTESIDSVVESNDQNTEFKKLFDDIKRMTRGDHRTACRFIQLNMKKNLAPPSKEIMECYSNKNGQVPDDILEATRDTLRWLKETDPFGASRDKHNLVKKQETPRRAPELLLVVPAPEPPKTEEARPEPIRYTKENTKPIKSCRPEPVIKKKTAAEPEIIPEHETPTTKITIMQPIKQAPKDDTPDIKIYDGRPRKLEHIISQQDMSPSLLLKRIEEKRIEYNSPKGYVPFFAVQAVIQRLISEKAYRSDDKIMNEIAERSKEEAEHIFNAYMSQRSVRESAYGLLVDLIEEHEGLRKKESNNHRRDNMEHFQFYEPSGKYRTCQVLVFGKHAGVVTKKLPGNNMKVRFDDGATLNYVEKSRNNGKK